MLDNSKPIGDCTAQELAIAILIDASLGRFDAEQVLHDLNTHRSLWRSFLMGRLILSGGEEPLPMGILLPLRDLHEHWNLDTLYVLAETEASVAPLLQLGDEWGCETGHYTVEQSQLLLGHSAYPTPIVWFWWD